MNVISLLLIATATALPQTKVETLAGQITTGQLQQLDSDFVSLNVAGKLLKVPTKEILSVTPVQKEGSTKSATTMITLLDGTQFQASQIVTAKREITLQSPTLGEVTLPLDLVHHIQLKKGEGSLAVVWNKLTDRKLKQDFLVIQKGSSLDHLSGVVGDINEKNIKFLLNDETIPVRRSKAFGVIFSRETKKTPNTICDVTLKNGEYLKLKSIKMTEKGLQSTLAADVEVTIPIDQVQLFDFSLGKIMYLSQTKPRNAEFTSFLGYEYSYRNNKNDAGKPLKLDKTYSRGVWIHSKTELTYRISRQYRRFQTIIGIDRNLTNFRQGHVHVVIKGDDKVLFDQDVKGTDKPKTLDLPVDNVLDLEILVDYGPNGDYCDHLDLIEAKVLK